MLAALIMKTMKTKKKLLKRKINFFDQHLI
jgi:hypothetical protein